MQRSLAAAWLQLGKLPARVGGGFQPIKMQVPGADNEVPFWDSLGLAAQKLLSLPEAGTGIEATETLASRCKSLGSI